MTSIGERAFSSCTNLTGITIPDSVTFIDYDAFNHCTNLTNVKLSKNLKTLRSYAFQSCHKLENLVIPDSVTKLGDYVVRDCKNLKSITFPKNTKSIGFGFCMDCTGLEYIKLPENLIDIGEYAFCGCTSLKTVETYSSLKVIGTRAFYNCDNLSTIKYHGNKKQWRDTDIRDGNVSVYNADVVYIGNTEYSLAKATVKVDNKVYTGKALTPAVTVTLNGETLAKYTDYTVTYTNNRNCGKATVTVTGKGDYEGTKTASFIIKPAKATISSVKSPKTKQVKVTWKKSAGGVSGYEVLLATNKKFSKGKKTYTVKASSASKTIKGLKKGTKYYAKVRAYKTVGKTKYYGAWSAVKSVKCK